MTRVTTAATLMMIMLLWTSTTKRVKFVTSAFDVIAANSRKRTYHGVNRYPSVWSTCQRHEQHLFSTSSSSSWSSSSSEKSSFSPDEFVARQKSVSQAVSAGAGGSNTGSQAALLSFPNEAEFLNHQKSAFDEMSQIFATGGTLSPELVPVYQHLAAQIIQTKIQATTTTTGATNTENGSNTKQQLRVLDAACGAGVLFPYLIEAATKHGIQEFHLTGVDLSSRMIVAARHRVQQLLSKHEQQQQDTAKTKVVVNVVESNIMNYNPLSSSETSSDDQALFDIVILNACFGNFWDAAAVLQHAADSLLVQPAVANNNTGGTLVISHPLGAAFVARLHQEDPATVPHLLPTATELQRMTRYLPLQVQTVVEQETAINGKRQPFYFATLSRVRHVLLPNIMRFRGTVAAGFGRGGKKLGFPTANLSPTDFRQALTTVPTGVYFGWAVLENRTTAVPHKAVVNVGYSPTFAGQENAEKIIEAHLILDSVEEKSLMTDFYGETMRLQLHGFLRPEIKFPSFPALIAQITMDRDEAKDVLEHVERYHVFQKDPFLTINNKNAKWVGSSGGSYENGSWEFQETDAALDELESK